MRVSRGEFVKLCGAAFVGVRAHASSWFDDIALRAATRADTAPAVAGQLDWHHASAPAFKPLVNSAFTARTGATARVRLTLDRVTERATEHGIEQFSLVFRGPAVAVDGLCAVHHPALGECDLFISRIGAPTDRSAVYEACFSRRLFKA